MHLLPAKTKTAKNAIDFRTEINYLYLCIFTIMVLFLSLFALRLDQINSNVLGLNTEKEVDKGETLKEIMLWEDFLTTNPQYFEGWMKLYTLSGDIKYLDRAKEINPN